MPYFTLFFVAFVSATLFPMSSEGFLIYYIKTEHSALLLLIAATLGNTLGSALNYYFGLKGEEYLERKKLLKKSKMAKAKKIFNRYGGYSLLLSWAPIIGDAITFIAGVLGYSFKKFLPIVTFAKFARYFFIVIITLNST